ncbi:Uma2 family endonuclease [Saccharomonospora sp. CUA-673]|uniref:Uma2 family endonuclease n=1 Tax=Saccharomonospora sp. CUA-673 TaxID=1904969 RepID=UPI0035158A7B
MDRLLTIDEYLALGETEPGYSELIGGRLLMSPSPAPGHNKASFRLLAQLEPQLPPDLDGVQDVDVDLELVPPDEPGYARRPDIVVADRAAFERVNEHGGMLRASEVALVVEIVSPGSKRIDNVDKRGEYADAGIPAYWIVDLTAPVSLVAFHRAGEFGYQDSGAVTGVHTSVEPFAATIDLTALG